MGVVREATTTTRPVYIGQSAVHVHCHGDATVASSLTLELCYLSSLNVIICFFSVYRVSECRCANSRKHPVAVRLSWVENACSRPLFRWTILTRKVGQTDLVLARDEGSLVGLCVQNRKSLCASVTICSTLVNIETHTHLYRQQLD